MISQFGKPVSQLSQEQIIFFYELLAKNLTTEISELLTERRFSTEQKMEQVRLLNTMVHDAVRMATAERRQTLCMTNDEMEKKVAKLVVINSLIAEYVNRAINRSYKFATKDWDSPSPPEPGWYVSPWHSEELPSA